MATADQRFVDGAAWSARAGVGNTSERSTARNRSVNGRQKH